MNIARMRLLGTTGVAALLCMTPMCVRLEARLVYNLSDSVPRGWYRIATADRLTTGDLVAVRPPADEAAFAASRRYLPVEVPLIKRVAAMQGQFVCLVADTVYVDGAPLATARRHDGAGRVLHAWVGCRVIEHGELFLLGDHDASFDSRYFGPLPLSCVIGRAVEVQLW